ncbi:LysM peptidoglycan-binding domain-containing protein [Culturomica massiliensis]|uniref:LysM peptidoglycan-binding domain-containing protein n=1 Tax=Culturomica massiliensis TaxID=1841857 RepID=UPI003AF143A1
MSSNTSRSILDFQRLCDYNVPYCGALDDGKGTIAYINSDVFVEQYSDDNYLYYHKRISLKIDKVTHIVKKGDSLSAIARKLGVSVQSIAASNGIRDVNMIRVGDVLDINVDIQYGYAVNCAIDLNSFGDRAKAAGHNPLSETVLYKVVSDVHSYCDNFAQSLVKNAGKSRIGSNFQLYVETSSGNVFQGNQYVKTYGLREFGSRMTQYTQPLKVGRVALPLAIAFEGVEIYDGWEQDGRTFGYNMQKQITGAAGSLTGAAIGAKYGALAGAKVGLLFKGVGAIPGAIIGGAVFGILGGIYGEKWTEDFFDIINTEKNTINEGK